MNIINDNVLQTILTSCHNSHTSSIRILDWHIDKNILKAGDNYSTQVSRLTVRYQLQDQLGNHASSQIQKTLFLKVPSFSPIYEMFRKMGCYDNEVIMYTTVFPQMYIIDEDEEYFTPRQYYFDDGMSLVLEDLSQSGFKCADRIEQLDVEHCLFALRSLAKFHALSVMLERTAGIPESVKRCPAANPHDKLDEFTISFVPQSLTFMDNLPENFKNRYPDMITYLKNQMSAETWTKMADDLSSTTFKVLNHGDFWTNNIMFKYDKYGTVEKVKLIDFQLSSWGTPVKDLIYFIITSVKFEVYRKYVPLLLKTYLDTLNRVLLRLDCPTYEMSNLLRDIDTMFPYTLIVLCCLLPTIISDPENPVVITYQDDKFEISGAAKAKQKHFQDIFTKWYEHLAVKGTLRIDE